MKRKAKRSTNRKLKAITDYDYTDTTDFLDSKDETSFKALGFSLPQVPPTQVISIRLPSHLLNEIRALSSDRDIAYQALVKMMLADSVDRMKKKKAA